MTLLWRRLLSLHRDDRGTTLPLVIYLAIAFFVFVMFISNVGSQAADRIEIQNDVDSATLSGGTVLARGMNLICESNVSMVQTLALAILVDALNRHEILSKADTLLNAWDRTADVLLQSTWPPTVILGVGIKLKVIQERISLIPIQAIVKGGIRDLLIGDGPPNPRQETPDDGLLWWAAWGFDKFEDLVYYGFPLYAMATAEQTFMLNNPAADPAQGEILLLLPLPPLLPVEEGVFGDLYDRTARKMREWRDKKDGLFQGLFLLSQYWSMYKVNTEHILEELFTGEKRGPPETPPSPDPAAAQRAQRELEEAERAERRAEDAFLDAASRLASAGAAQGYAPAADAAEDLRSAVADAHSARVARDDAQRDFDGAHDGFNGNPTEAGGDAVANRGEAFQEERRATQRAFNAVQSAAGRLASAVAAGRREEPPVEPTASYENALDDYRTAAGEWNAARNATDAAASRLHSEGRALESSKGKGPKANPFEPKAGQKFVGRKFPIPYMPVKEWKRYYYVGLGRTGRGDPWLPGVMPNRAFGPTEALGNAAYACIELANATATDTFTPDWYAKLSRSNPAYLTGMLDAVPGGAELLGPLTGLEGFWHFSTH